MKLGALILALLLSSLPASAQASQSAIKSSSGGKGAAKPAAPALTLPPEKARPVTVPRFETPPRIDGKLDDEVWKSAAILGDFYQIQQHLS